MKNTAFLEIPTAEYDPNLDDYVKNNPNPFPKKLAEATAFVEKHGLPERFMPSKKSKQKKDTLPLTNLQKELLEVYALEPSEQQMAALKAFLAQLFSKTTSSQTNEAEIMA